MSDDEYIMGKVASIVNEREIAINIGTEDGVERGMRFAILSKEPLEIRDPETNDLLGVEDREKGRVQAIRVHDRYTICSTYRRQRSPLAIVDLQRAMFGEGPETFRLRDSALPPPLSPEESYVKIGDRVIAIDEPVEAAES